MANGLPIPENRIFRSRDPAETDENNWPSFNLRDVEVISKKGKLANLLHANLDYPVTVTGTLQSLNKNNSHLLLPSAPPKPKNVTIQIKNVLHYAFGAYENGDVDFWAAGDAGWHCIKPATSYVDIFQDMIQAVHIFYFIADSYGTGRKPRYQDLFASYAGINHITPQAAAERFYSHGQFLASRMMKGDEGIKWGSTSLYHHLRKMQPTSFGLDPPPPPAKPLPSQSVPARAASSLNTTSRATLSRPTQPRTSKPNTTAAARPSDIKVSRISRRSRLVDADEQAEARSRAMRVSQRREPLLSEVNKQKARDLWKFMQKTVNKIRPSPADITVERFAHSLLLFYTFEDQEKATEYLQCLAADLIPLMQAKHRRAYAWTRLPVYEDLVEAKPSAAARRRMAAMELELRAHPLSDDEETSSAESESSEEEVLDESEIHHSMSVLRPKSGSEFSGKGASRSGKGKAAQRDDAEPSDDEIEVMDIDSPSKRKSVSEDDEEVHPPKRFTRSQGDHDPELEDLEFEAQQSKSTGLAIRKKSQSNGARPTSVPVIISEPIFSTRATESGDVWTCPREGCMHKVYGASENAALIKEHHLDHDEIFSLVRSEENRTHLPVSNLLKRIREMAESQHGPRLGQIDMGGNTTPITTIFPARILRKV